MSLCRYIQVLKPQSVYSDPVPLPPNESLLDIPYHRYSNHLDDPNFQFTSLVTSDKSKMALRLQVGHAQGVSGKVRYDVFFNIIWILILDYR